MHSVSDSLMLGLSKLTAIVGADKKAEVQKRAKLMRVIDDVKHAPASTSASSSASGVAASALEQFSVIFK